ncbi:MAG: hypothetical protein L0Z49_14415 [Actinobacteria bacterium]|nr:hypothetical protein [Actinomycetota bacterium]
MVDETLRGRRVSAATRPPRAVSEKRTCIHPGCGTRLSRYNRREYCYTHAPTKFPRLRGRVATDQ